MFQRIGPARGFTDEESLLLDAVDRLVSEVVAANAEKTDRTAAFPWDNVAAINAIGLNQMFLPEAAGGNPLSYGAYLECVRRISAACAATGIIWATNFHATKPIIDFGTPEQVGRLLRPMADGGLAALCITEPEAGSDATGMRLRLTPDGGEVVVSGSKTFITNGDVADVLLVFGKWPGFDSDRAAITAVVVERGTPGLSVTGHIDKMGIRGSSTVTLAFDDCRVPRANVLGEPGQGLRILLASLNKSRPSVAAHALGIARAAFDAAVAYINERIQSGRRIIEFQGIQFLVADLAADLATTERWLWHVADLVDAGATDFAVEASLLKLRASDVAMRTATEAVQLHGGYGYMREFPVERFFRDVRLWTIASGTSEMMREIIARRLLG